MLIGHLGLAFIAKRAHPAAPLFWLAAAAFLPDIVRFILLLFVESTRAELASHSIPAVIVLAALATIFVRLRCRLWTVGLIGGLLALSHYAGDFVTGCKPTWLGGSYVGLGLYHRPLLDLLVEIPLVVLGWKMMREHLPPVSILARYWIVLSLVFVQLLFLITNCRGGICVVGQSVWKWNPDEKRWPVRVNEDSYRCGPPVLPSSWRRTS
jgi:hypothetical protein